MYRPILLRAGTTPRYQPFKDSVLVLEKEKRDNEKRGKREKKKRRKKKKKANPDR